jgi:hypothetical protein
MGLRIDRDRYPFSCESRVEGEHTIHEMKNVEYKYKMYSHATVYVKTKYDYRFIVNKQLNSHMNNYVADFIQINGAIVKDFLNKENT